MLLHRTRKTSSGRLERQGRKPAVRASEWSVSVTERWHGAQRSDTGVGYADRLERSGSLYQTLSCLHFFEAEGPFFISAPFYFAER